MGGKAGADHQQRCLAMERSSVLTANPKTTQFKHISQPTHVIMTMEDGTKSMLLAEQIMR